MKPDGRTVMHPYVFSSLAASRMHRMSNPSTAPSPQGSGYTSPKRIVGQLMYSHSAVSMFFHDAIISARVHTTPVVEVVISVALTAAIVGITQLLARQRAGRINSDAQAGA